MYETPPDESNVAVDLPEQEQRSSELVECAEGDEEQKGGPDPAEAAHSMEKDCLSQETEMLQRNMSRHWKSAFGNIRAGRVWSSRLRMMHRSTARLGSEGGRWPSQGD